MSEAILYNPRRINDSKVFWYYHKNYTGDKRQKIKNKDDFAVITNAFWRKVGELIIESEGGVMVKNFAYFGIMMSYNKVVRIEPYTRRKIYLYNTDHHEHYPIMFTNITKYNPLKCWVMDRRFKKSLFKEMRDKIEKGKRYLLNFTLMNKIYKNQKFFGNRAHDKY